MTQHPQFEGSRLYRALQAIAVALWAFAFAARNGAYRLWEGSNLSLIRQGLDDRAAVLAISPGYRSVSLWGYRRQLIARAWEPARSLILWGLAAVALNSAMQLEDPLWIGQLSTICLLVVIGLMLASVVRVWRVVWIGSHATIDWAAIREVVERSPKLVVPGVPDAEGN